MIEMGDLAETPTIPLAARQLVDQQRLGFVATICKDGSPNLSPKGTVSVWDSDHLVFADLDSPGTVANLERDARVEVNVVDPVLRKGWRFKGRAEVLRGGPRFEQGLRFFERAKLRDAPKRIRSLVLVRVEKAAPLISPAYSTGRGEAEIRTEFWSRYKRIYEPRSQTRTRTVSPQEGKR